MGIPGELLGSSMQQKNDASFSLQKKSEIPVWAVQKVFFH